MVLTREILAHALEYPEYVRLSEQRFAEGLTTADAPEMNTPERLEYTKLNLQRMKRIAQTPLTEPLLEALRGVKQAQIWVVLTESWCGDAAQNLPVLAVMEAASPLVSL